MHLRVCIVALNAWPAVQPSGGRQVGGMETNAWTMARSLAAELSTEVTLVVRHTRSIPNAPVEGVRIVPVIERLRGLRQRVSQTVEVMDHFPWIRPRRWNRTTLGDSAAGSLATVSPPLTAVCSTS